MAALLSTGILYPSHQSCPKGRLTLFLFSFSHMIVLFYTKEERPPDIAGCLYFGRLCAFWKIGQLSL